MSDSVELYNLEIKKNDLLDQYNKFINIHGDVYFHCGISITIL